MKPLYALVFLSIFLFFACSKKEEKTTFTDEFGLTWQSNLKDAFEKSKRENRIIMVMTVSKGCGWCKKMKKETLSNPKIKKRLQKYIWVQADRETPSEKAQVPEFKHVPIIFFMQPNREVIENLRGFFKPEDFLYYIRELQKDLED